MSVTKKQFKQLIENCGGQIVRIRPSECGYHVDILGMVEKPILLGLRIGCDRGCKLDKKTGKYKHRFFVLDTVLRKGSYLDRAVNRTAKYERWLAEILKKRD